jgi:integrase
MGQHLMSRPPKYVQGFIDRHGKPRFYFRRAGFKAEPLPGLPWSPAFMAAYESALAGQPAQIGSSRVLPGTISALVVAYYNSAEFKHELAAETRRKRRNIAEQFREQHGDKRVALLRRQHILKMLTKIDRPHAKKNWLKTIRGLMRFAVMVGVRSDDPSEGVKLARLAKTDGFRTWSEEDIAAFREHHAIGTRARLALELLLGTAQRRGDVIRMGRQHIRNSILTVRQSKTGTVLKIPVHQELKAALDAMSSEHLTFLTTAFGKSFSSDGFGHWFREMCDDAGLHGLTAHGLRKAACRRLAEAGCSEKQIAAISGHASLNEVARYTKAADQSALGGRRDGQNENIECQTLMDGLTNWELSL